MYRKTPNIETVNKDDPNIIKKWNQLKTKCELLTGKQKIKPKNCVSVLKMALEFFEVHFNIMLSSKFVTQLDFNQNSIPHAIFVSIFRMIKDDKYSELAEKCIEKMYLFSCEHWMILSNFNREFSIEKCNQGHLEFIWASYCSYIIYRIFKSHQFSDILYYNHEMVRNDDYFQNISVNNQINIFINLMSNDLKANIEKLMTKDENNFKNIPTKVPLIDIGLVHWFSLSTLKHSIGFQRIGFRSVVSYNILSHCFDQYVDYSIKCISLYDNKIDEKNDLGIFELLITYIIDMNNKEIILTHDEYNNLYQKIIKCECDETRMASTFIELFFYFMENNDFLLQFDQIPSFERSWFHILNSEWNLSYLQSYYNFGIKLLNKFMYVKQQSIFMSEHEILQKNIFCELGLEIFRFFFGKKGLES